MNRSQDTPYHAAQFAQTDAGDRRLGAFLHAGAPQFYAAPESIARVRVQLRQIGDPRQALDLFWLRNDKRPDAIMARPDSATTPSSVRRTAMELSRRRPDDSPATQKISTKASNAVLEKVRDRRCPEYERGAGKCPVPPPRQQDR